MRLELKIRLTPAQVAEAFCEMDDEQQAQFFIECARIAAGWDGQFRQWFYVGKHLRTCECSNDNALAMVAEIAEGASVPTPGEGVD